MGNLGKMIKEIIVVALVLVIAQCANVIPIKRQGKNFPVPYVDPNKSDDYFDDQFYPDINDENYKVGSRGSRGNSGSGATPAVTVRPGKPEQAGKKPGQGGRRPRPGQGGSSARPGQGGGSARPGQGGGSARPGQGGGSGRPGQGGGSARPGQSNTSSGVKRPQKGGQDKQERLRAKYQNTPAKFIFKSPQFNDAGLTPKVTYFKTRNTEHIIARGGARDEYVAEILEGDSSKLVLSTQTMGKESRAVLKNPNGGTVVGRVKTYKDGYRG